MQRFEVIAVGNELLAGDTLDTNFRAIAQGVRELGAEIGRHLTVPDVEDEIVAALTESLERVELVALTGGLGPTADDLTRFAVARALARPLVRDEPTVAWLEERFRAHGVARMPKSNEVQALFPEGAAILHNVNGSAHGFRCDRGRQAIFVFPGPPRELEPMIESHLVPWLRERGGLPVVRVHRIRTQGIGESLLAERIAGLPRDVAGVELGFYPQDPGVDLKVTARGADPDIVEAALDAAVRQLTGALGDHVFGAGRVTLPEVLGGLLRRRGETLALAESCTGGGTGGLVTSAAGSSDYFDGGVVTYSYAAKEALLDVPAALLASEGAVSEPVARFMAERIRSLRGTTWGVALTGVAGPGGGTEAKPVGLVYIAVAGPDGVEVRATRHAGNRLTIQRRAAMTALDLLRRRILARDVAESGAGGEDER